MPVPFESPMDRLRAEWDRKAADDAFAASCPDRTDWTPESFRASGDALFARRVATHLPAFAEAVGVPAGQFRVLDFGCGAGRLVSATRAACGEVHAVDVSPKMLARAHETAGGLSNCRFALSDGLTLQCVNRQTYHLALCIDVLGHQPSDAFVRYLLGQFQDKLVPGGVVVADLPAPFVDARVDAILAMLQLTRLHTERDDGRLWLQLQRTR